MTGWKEEGPYTALVLAGADADASFLADSKSFLNGLGQPYFIFPYKDTVVLLLQGELPAALVAWLKGHEQLVTGQGVTAPDLKALPDSCRQGQQASSGGASTSSPGAILGPSALMPLLFPAR